MAREKADSMKKKAAEEKAAPVAAGAAPGKAAVPATEKSEPPAKKPSVKEKAAPAEKKAPAAEKKAAAPGRKKAPAEKAPAPSPETPAPVEEVPAPVNKIANLPRRSIAFIGSECHPFVKTGGLGDVMYALPRELARLNCDVRVILPRYACIPQEYQDKMIYRGEFYMDLGNTGRSYYVGIMEYIWDGVVYDFIDNQEFFTAGRPYTNLVDDIPKYANLLKGGLAYADRITTVSGTYAWEIQTREYGEGLENHLRYHSGKLRGIVNGIDYSMWNPETDPSLPVHYSIGSVLKGKLENKLALQRELGLEEDRSKFVIGLISRLTNQKGLDLVNAIMPQVLDGNTQVVVLGTGDKQYEDAFRYYEYAHKGTFSACIQYDEARAHRIYAGADVLLVPSRFEPCGLTQLNAMHYGTLPIVRETGGLKDTVEPHNDFTGDGNGFTFDRYEAGLLLDAINRAKTLYFNNRYHWDEVVRRDMDKDVSWTRSAQQYKDLYLELTQW